MRTNTKLCFVFYFVNILNGCASIYFGMPITAILGFSVSLGLAVALKYSRHTWYLNGEV